MEEMITRIIIVRHGESRGNLENRFRGRMDYELNETGLKQAGELAKALSSLAPEVIYSSPLKRALQTAEPIARDTGLPVIQKNGFNNISLGYWEGRLKKEIAKEYPEKWDLWLTNPEKLEIEGGESFASVQKRAFSALEEIVEENRGKTLMTVSHRTTIKPLIAACIGIKEPYFWKIHVDTASYSIIHHSSKRGYCLFSLNFTDHLSKLNIEWN